MQLTARNDTIRYEASATIDTEIDFMKASGPNSEDEAYFTVMLLNCEIKGKCPSGLKCAASIQAEILTTIPYTTNTQGRRIRFHVAVPLKLQRILILTNRTVHAIHHFEVRAYGIRTTTRT